MDIWL